MPEVIPEGYIYYMYIYSFYRVIVLEWNDFFRTTSERFVRCVKGTLGSCPERLRRRSSIKGTSSGWRRMAINQINHLAIGPQMFQRKPPQMITLPPANVQQNSLKIPKGKIVSQPPFFRNYVSFIDCTIRTNSHAKKLSEFKLKLHFLRFNFWEKSQFQTQ